MANNPISISLPVGVRNGVTPMPNTQRDLDAVTELFDRIPVRSGGTAEIGGLWASERNALIAEITGQIIQFQTINKRPVIDGVIDPNGGTLKLMNALANPAPAGSIRASVVAAPTGFPDAIGGAGLATPVADVTSLNGSAPLRIAYPGVDLVRRLVSVNGSSIKWFGVSVGRGVIAQAMDCIPHINFTPTPAQGHYYDNTYDSFGGWGQLWADYTWVIGGQVAAAGVNQICVIPLYKNSQSSDLGDFLLNWKETVAAVVTAAINSIDAYVLRDTYTFESIVSSSFSNGYVAHQNFNGAAVNAAAMTSVLFDLDGQAGGSQWRPANGVIYLNRAVPNT
jgi:hypothetical protein